ncbi:MAG: hypothetical protein ACLP8X_18070 [Streptosporangiaceae bacterium]
MWPLSTARARLGEVVDAATRFPSPVPQILVRHRQPGAAVIDARALDGLPGNAERIDLQALLEEDGTVTLQYDPGQSGACDKDGTVTTEPRNPRVRGDRSRLGRRQHRLRIRSGPTIAEALLRIYRRSPLPDPRESGTCSDDPPF